MAARQATRQEVLDAVTKGSVYSSPVYGDYDDKIGKRPVLREERKLATITRADVAERVVKEWGISPKQQQFVSRASMLRQHISLTSVKKHLQDLVSEGIIVAVPGDHWSLASRYGTSRRAVYFLSIEAQGIAEAGRKARVEGMAQATAETRARAFILAKYATEYESLVDEYLAEEAEDEGDAFPLWPTPQQSLLLIVI